MDHLKAKANKLSPRWHGPCLITARLGNEVYKLKISPDGQEKEVHAEDLKKFLHPLHGDPTILYFTSIPNVLEVEGPQNDSFLVEKILDSKIVAGKGSG